MVDAVTLSRWLHWAGFALLALVLMLVEFLPLSHGEETWPGPQWLLLFAMAWVLRRPDYMPVLLAALVLLVADFLYMRPPGLWAALSVLVLEFLRSRSLAAREWPFPVEWLVVAILLTGLYLANRLVLGLLASPQPAFTLELQELVSTILAYPIALGLSVLLMGVRRPQIGDGAGWEGRA